MDQCAKCGSKKVIPLLGIVDQGRHSDGTLKTFVNSNPEAWVFKGAVEGRLLVRVCGECGYTELYTTNARELYEAYCRSVDS